MPDQTVFVTGATGFIAKHIVLNLLNAGYRVRGSVRALTRGDEVRAAVAPHLKNATDLKERLDFMPLDLTRDAGWDTALQGCDALIHTASPFPIAQPKDQDTLIRPAVEGALRALKAAQAAGIARVVMTSSEVAVRGTDLRPGRAAYDEDDWTDVNRPGIHAYAKSKTLAERAAWDFARDQAPGMRLTTINPSFVLGPPLDRHYGSSVGMIERLLRGKDPMLPQVSIPIVDVRDVAEAHVRALERDASIGKRILVSDTSLWMTEMARAVKAAHPDRRMATRAAPDLLMRVMALWDRQIASIVPVLGQELAISHDRAAEMLGIALHSGRGRRSRLCRLADRQRHRLRPGCFGLPCP